jgi:acid stress chaperone HdeB
MNKFSRVCLILALTAVAAPPAPAQVTLDVAKITCGQFALFTIADPHDIAAWLSGYYNGRKNNTILDIQAFKERTNKLIDYCRINDKETVMEAVEKLLGPGK